MSGQITPIPLTPIHVPSPVLIQAEPQPIEIDLNRTAVMVVDMQNAYISKGGMADLLKWSDVSISRSVIDPIRRINEAARGRGMKVIYIATIYSNDLSEVGNPQSPGWYRGRSIAYRHHPEWSDKLVTRGTWGADIIDELKPQKDDLVVEKAKYSAFFGTSLDIVLRTYNIKYLIFTGAGTNICVESTLRDAFYRDYFCVLASDATANLGPPFTQEATLYNVRNYYGWITTANDIITAMKPR